MTATEWSQQYVQEWLREGETELWAGQAKTLRGKPVITVVHCSSFDGEPACIEVRVGKRIHASGELRVIGGVGSRGACCGAAGARATTIPHGDRPVSGGDRVRSSPQTAHCGGQTPDSTDPRPRRNPPVQARPDPLRPQAKAHDGAGHGACPRRTRASQSSRLRIAHA